MSARSVVRVLLKGLIGSSLLLVSCIVPGVATAQLPAVVTYGNRYPLPLPSGSANLTKVTRDSYGDIFIMSSSVPRIDEIPANGPAFTVVPSTDASLAAGAYNVNFTVDPAGNIYPYGKYSGVIYKIPRNSNGTYALANESVVTTSFSALNNLGGNGITDLAVDSLGNLYASTTSGHADGTWTGTGLMMSGPDAPNGKYLAQYAAYTAGALYPAEIAVDSSNNVYYADTAHAYEITAASVLSSAPVSTQIGYSGTGTCPGCATLPSTISGLFLDALNNVYLISSSAASFYVIPNTGSAYSTASTTYLLPGSVSGHSSYTYGTVDNQGELITVFGGSLEKYGANFYAAYAAGAVAVGTANNGYTVYFLFTQSTTLRTGTAVTLTGSGAAYGGSSLYTSSNGVTLGTVNCAAGTTYTAGQSCYVGVNNKSQTPGAFNATVSLLGSAGNTLATFSMVGTATGSAVTVDGRSTAIGTGYLAPAGIAIDNTGAMYVADPDGNAVYKYAAGSTSATVGAALGSGLSEPSGVAVDASGDIFIADTGNNRVVAISGGTQTTVSVPGYELSSPRGIAVDMSGNLYIADTGNARVLEIANPFTGEPTVTDIVGFTGLVSPYAIAFGPYNDVYVADKGANAVYMLGAFSTTASTFPYVSPSSQVTVGSGFNGPTGVAVDASGTVYVADSGSGKIYKVPSISSAYTYTTQSTFLSGLSKPFGIAMDTTNDLYYTDQAAPQLYFAQRSAATTGTATTIAFGTVASGGTGNQTATIANAGLSTSLTVASVSTPSSPFGGTTSGCTTLTPGSTCTDALTFSSSTVGAQTQNVTITDNAMGTTGATQLIALTADVSAAIASVTMTGPTSVAYGDTATYTVTAKDSSGNAAQPLPNNSPYTVSIPGGTSTMVSLTNGVGTFTLPVLTVGSYTPSVTIGGFTGSVTLAVTKAPLFITSANVSRAFDVANPTLATPTYGGYASGDSASTVVSTTATSTLTAGVTRVTAPGTYTNYITPSGGTLTTFGSANYTPIYVSGDFIITGSTPQTILFPPLPNFTHGATTYTLTGQSTSGLPLSYSVSAGSATMSGNVLTVTAAGPVTIEAIQNGNASYAAATPVSVSFTAQ